MSTTALVLASNIFIDPSMGEPGFLGTLDFVQREIVEESGGVERCAGAWALGGWRRRLWQTLLTLAQFKELEVLVVSDGSKSQDDAAALLSVEVHRCMKKLPRPMRLKEAFDEDTLSAAIAYALAKRDIERALVVGRWDTETGEAIAGRLTYRLDVGSKVINVDSQLGFLERDGYTLMDMLPLPRGVDAARVNLADASPEPI